MPPKLQPTIDGMAVNAGGYNGLGMVQSEGREAGFNEIRRTDAEGNIVILSKSLPFSAAFADFNAISGKTYFYQAIEYGEAGEEPEYSNVLSLTLNISGVILHKVSKGEESNNADLLTVMRPANLEGSSREINVPAKILHLPALDKPVIETGRTVARVWRIPMKIIDLRDGTREKLNGWLKTHSVLCCRDDRGRRMFGIIRGVKERLDITGDYPFELHEVDYRETVR
jgi:hypothetical protein